MVYDDCVDPIATVVPFLQVGLEAGERCVYVVGDHDAETIRSRLYQAGIDLDGEVERGRMTLVSRWDVSFPDGQFDPHLLIAVVRQTIEASLAAGFTGVRLVAEMTWALDLGVEPLDLVHFEAIGNGLYPNEPLVAICLYNRRRHPDRILHGALRTHPIVVVGDQVCENIYYEPPDLVQNPEAADRRVDHMLEQLLRARRAEDARAQLLREQGVRRAAEESQRRFAEERAWFQAVFAHVPSGIVIVRGGLDREVIVNRRAAAIFGESIEADVVDWSASAAAGRCHEEHRRTIEALGVGRALAGEEVSSREATVRQASGRVVPVLASASPIRGADGALLGAVIIFDDISQIKEFERLRAEWTAVVAHDLRQPLTAIQGYASLLARQLRVRAPSLAPAAEHIVSASRRLERMTGDLLQASRLDTTGMELRREPVDLGRLGLSVAQRMSEALEGHPVLVETTGEVREVLADADRLEQVLANLLSNAAKYSYPGSEIRLNIADEGDQVRISVANHGDGISAEDIARIFDRFHRARAARERGIGGLGLGLYIARGLVEAHGGRISVESIPGQVTTFHVTLPRSVSLV